MSRIFLTGDTHREIDIGKLNSKYFPEGKALTKTDYVIVLGDFGLVWDGSPTDKYWQNWLSNKPWTTLFLVGNHENYDLLDNYPIINKDGIGEVRQITPSILQLLNAHVYTIADKSFFIMGGAVSIDKEFRIPGMSWWPQEVPSHEDMCKGMDTALSIEHFNYVLTHAAPSGIVTNIGLKCDAVTEYLEGLSQCLNYGEWYCGHYHIAKQITPHFRIMYNDIEEII